MNTKLLNFVKIFALASTTVLGSFIISNLQPIKQAEAQPRTVRIRGRHSFHSYRDQNRYITHGNFLAFAAPGSANNSTFNLHNGLADSRCTSFESVNWPGYYLAHGNFRIRLAKNDGTQEFARNATFCPRKGLASTNKGISFESLNYPGYYIRHRDNFELWIDQPNGTNSFLKDATFIRIQPLDKI